MKISNSFYFIQRSLLAGILSVATFLATGAKQAAAQGGPAVITNTTGAIGILVRIERIVAIAIPIAVTFVVFFVIYHAIMVAKGGNNVDEHKKSIIWGIVFLAIALSLWGLIAVLSRSLGIGIGGDAGTGNVIPGVQAY